MKNIGWYFTLLLQMTKNIQCQAFDINITVHKLELLNGHTSYEVQTSGNG